MNRSTKRHYSTVTSPRKTRGSNSRRARSLPLVTFLFVAAVLVLSAALSPLAANAAPPSATQALPSCSWILKTSGTGVTNVAYPDTDATYWTMPLDTTKWKGMIIKGKYARARFFSFTTYVESGASVQAIYDENIQPDQGSTNPFQRGLSPKPHKYTVTIGDVAGPNPVALGNTPLAWIIYRIYLPNKDMGTRAGVPLPRVTLVALDGTQVPLRKCPFEKPGVQMALLLMQLRNNGFTTQADYWENKFLRGDNDGFTDAQCQPTAQPVFWIPKYTGGYFPNPANKYIALPGMCFAPGKVVVVRGKAPVYPDTYNDQPIWKPAIPGIVQLRYWSMCNNDQTAPYPVVQCVPDHTTNLDRRGFYTYIIGQGDAPDWLPANATWLSWGIKPVPNILILRNMLPQDWFTKSVKAAIDADCAVDNSSTPTRDQVLAGASCAQGVMGKYYPRTAYCDRQVVEKLGWRACFRGDNSN